MNENEKKTHPQGGDVLKLITIHEFLDEAQSFLVLLLLLQTIPVRSRAILGQHLGKGLISSIAIEINKFCRTILTSWDPVNTAFRMLTPIGGCG